MTTLPDALRPWREWLSWFDPELAAQVGSLLQRLHPLLGPFRGKTQGGEPELEGLDDLRPRGRYEHLLTSEWLLADEMPDEFLRRAASGEHIFLAPRPRARRADRKIVALFDAGPLQLGAPRLGHLAMWILLARRAQQARGEFRWGTLQSPGELFAAGSNDLLKAMLKRRSFAMPGDAEHAKWRESFDADPSGGERWLIGPFTSAAELQRAPEFTHRVSLRKDLPGTSLDVALRERESERRVQLRLPEPAAAVPLLRGTFKHEPSPARYTSDPRAVSLQRPPVIAIDGTRVALVLRDEPAALVFLVPRKAHEKTAAPRYQQWTRGYSALAMTLHGKRMGMLLSDADELRLWGSSMSMKPCPTQEEFHAPGSTAAWLPMAWLRSGKAQRVCMIDHSDRLLRWEAGSNQLVPNAYPVLGLRQTDSSHAMYAEYRDGSVGFVHLLGQGDPAPSHAWCPAPRDAAVLFARRYVAVRIHREPSEIWRIGDWRLRGMGTDLKLPGEARAIGLIRDPSRTARILALDRNALRLHAVNGSNELLFTAPNRLVSWTVCPNTGLVAMFTDRREFILVSAVTREVLLSVKTSHNSHVDA